MTKTIISKKIKKNSKCLFQENKQNIFHSVFAPTTFKNFRTFFSHTNHHWNQQKEMHCSNFLLNNQHQQKVCMLRRSIFFILLLQSFRPLWKLFTLQRLVRFIFLLLFTQHSHLFFLLFVLLFFLVFFPTVMFLC